MDRRRERDDGQVVHARSPKNLSPGLTQPRYPPARIAWADVTINAIPVGVGQRSCVIYRDVDSAELLPCGVRYGVYLVGFCIATCHAEPVTSKGLELPYDGRPLQNPRCRSPMVSSQGFVHPLRAGGSRTAPTSRPVRGAKGTVVVAGMARKGVLC